MPAGERGARPRPTGSRTSQSWRSVVPYGPEYLDTRVVRDVLGPYVADDGRVGGDGVDQLSIGLVHHGRTPTLEPRQAQNVSIVGTFRHRDDVLQEQHLDLRVCFVQRRAQAVAVLGDGQAKEQSPHQGGIELMDVA